MENQLEENLYMIQELYPLINGNLPCDQSRILSVKYSPLSHADQYGLTLLKLIIELVNTSTGEEWSLSALAKTLPRYSLTHDIIEIQAIFTSEIGIYTTAKSAIDSFLREKGIEKGADFFIHHLGGRINLNKTNEIDQNAALIIMDFKAMGYKTVHRRTGFDFDTAKAIIRALAKFHGSTLGLKMNRPKEFKEKVQPFLRNGYSGGNFEKTVRSHMIEVLKNEGFSPGVIHKAVETFDRKCSREVREPWATFVHTNVWIKNILVKFDQNKYPQDVKLKGFQESEYNSPMRDLLYFLFSSVQLTVLRQNLDELVDFYYYNFLNVLRNLGVDTKLFSRPYFNKEMRATASQREFYQVVCGLYPILAPNWHICNLADEKFIKDPLHVHRLCYVVGEFEKRGWLCA